jgi:cob(I)alamin adenosyltransferase
MKLYTKSGDEGDTTGAGGQRIHKSGPFCEAVGTLDELDANLGLCAAAAEAAGQTDLAQTLRPLQRELLAVGAVLAAAGGEAPGVTLDESAVTRMEGQIDAVCEALPEQTHFILPGGCELAARLHVARTVCRRAERRIVALADSGAPVPPAVLHYLNRLGDYLFALGRQANRTAGIEDEMWSGG